jgi:hypothetical protein
MKENIIVVGDSFCSAAEHWPKILANLLDLNLICYTNGAGQSWWDARNWLQSLPAESIDNASVMVFAHTNAERIPTTDKQLGKIDHSAPAQTEIQTAIKLYYKYIFEPPFMSWAQQQWFKEIGDLYGHKQLVHLHCFPWTLSQATWLSGINITTNLTALSLNELGAEQMTLFNDHRPNHLNEHNNHELAGQVAELINTGGSGSHALDTGRFQQATQRWFEPW